MIGLANRVRMTIERSPGSLLRLSLAMHGLDQLQPLGKRFWPCEMFMSRRSVIRAQQNPTTNSLHAHDRKERAGLRRAASIPKSVTCRGAPTAAAAARQTLPSHSGSNKKVGCGSPWVSGRVATGCECFGHVICDSPRHPTTRSDRFGRLRAQGGLGFLARGRFYSALKNRRYDTVNPGLLWVWVSGLGLDGWCWLAWLVGLFGVFG